MKYNDPTIMRRIVALLALAITPSAFSAEPLLDAKSAILIDEKSGVVLWQKDPHAIRYPASTTKILTAILLLEKTEPDDIIVAPSDTETVEGASLHLRPGERVTSADLLKAILLRSANDACHALAVHIAGSDREFAKAMNERAKQIGCLRTHFMAPHGLHNDKHYTTAFDLALIAREAMKFPEIRNLVGHRKETISRSINTEDTVLISKNKWLSHDKSADGIKTGFTRAARATFVGSATRNGFRFISVVLQTEEWEKDTQALMNFGFRTFTRTVVHARGAIIANRAISGGAMPSVDAYVDRDVHYAHRKGETPSIAATWLAIEPINAPIKKGQSLGKALLSDGMGWTQEVELFAAHDVERSATSMAVSFALPGIAGLLAFSAIAMRKKSRKWSITSEHR